MNSMSLAPGHSTVLKESEILLERMRTIGIKRNCRNWREHIRAKRTIENMAKNAQEYDLFTRTATAFICV